jgi:hypothetical protein
MDGIPCKCGCGEIVTTKRPDGTFREWKHGHNSRSRANEWSKKPDSTNARTGRWRARQVVDLGSCVIAHTGQCKGRIEAHHLDKNPVNNEPGNVVPACKTHHSFLDRGAITLDNPRIPEFWVDGYGKRRYKKPKA